MFWAAWTNMILAVVLQLSSLPSASIHFFGLLWLHFKQLWPLLNYLVKADLGAQLYYY